MQYCNQIQTCFFYNIVNISAVETKTTIHQLFAFIQGKYFLFLSFLTFFSGKYPRFCKKNIQIIDNSRALTNQGIASVAQYISEAPRHRIDIFALFQRRVCRDQRSTPFLCLYHHQTVGQALMMRLRSGSDKAAVPFPADTPTKYLRRSLDIFIQIPGIFRITDIATAARTAKVLPFPCRHRHERHCRCQVPCR